MMVGIKAIALTVALAVGVAATSASAMPLSAQNGLSKSADAVVLADYRDNKKRGWNKNRRHYAPGSRHKHGPKNWHRYNKRPGDWRTRGCIIVGPVWWCP
jgi:hypothetical protein